MGGQSAEYTYKATILKDREVDDYRLILPVVFIQYVFVATVKPISCLLGAFWYISLPDAQYITDDVRGLNVCQNIPPRYHGLLVPPVPDYLRHLLP
jgi:hypothetical protein